MSAKSTGGLIQKMDQMHGQKCIYRYRSLFTILTWIVEEKKKVFFSTPSSLLALNFKNGQFEVNEWKNIVE